MLSRTSSRQTLSPYLLLVFLLPLYARGQTTHGARQPEEATHFDFSKSRAFPGIFAPYTLPYVPPPRLDNSHLLQNLISDGKLELSIDDAIALALENNLEIAVARYDLPIAQTDFLRAKGGGAARGAAGESISNSIFGGSLGTGVGGGGVGGGRGAGGILGGGINGVGSAACCDPSFYVTYRQAPEIENLLVDCTCGAVVVFDKWRILVVPSGLVGMHPIDQVVVVKITDLRQIFLVGH